MTYARNFHKNVHILGTTHKNTFRMTLVISTENDNVP